MLEVLHCRIHRQIKHDETEDASKVVTETLYTGVLLLKSKNTLENLEKDNNFK